MIKAWTKYSIYAFILGLVCFFLGFFLVFPIIIGALLWLSIPFFPIMRVIMPGFFIKRGF